VKLSHDRNVRSLAKKTLGSTRVGRAIRLPGALWRRGLSDILLLLEDPSLLSGLNVVFRIGAELEGVKSLSIQPRLDLLLLLTPKRGSCSVSARTSFPLAIVSASCGSLGPALIVWRVYVDLCVANPLFSPGVGLVSPLVLLLLLCLPDTMCFDPQYLCR